MNTEKIKLHLSYIIGVGKLFLAKKLFKQYKKSLEFIYFQLSSYFDKK